MEDFNYLTIYNQEFEELDKTNINIEPYCENFSFSLLDKNHTNKEFKDMKKILENNIEKCFHVFIGGFLSRYINNVDKSENLNNFEECFIAGNLILKKYLILLKYNIDYIIDIDEFNVVVPKVKKCLKDIIYKEKKEELRKIRTKEKKFILDCVGASKKEYNSILDFNSTYFLSKNNKKLNHINNNSIINQNDKIGIIKKIKNYSENKNSIKIKLLNKDRLNYNIYNYTNLSKIRNKYTPSILNKQKNILNSTIKNNKINFTGDINSKQKNKSINESYNNYNNTPNNYYIKTLPNFFTQKKPFDNNCSNNINKNIGNKKLKLKIYNINLKKRRYDADKKDRRFLIDSKKYDSFDSSDNTKNNYIENLFKLYQPKKNINNFLYNLSNIKKSKK